jgi:hypothetical protein
MGRFGGFAPARVPPHPPAVKVLEAGVVGNDSTFSVGSQVRKTFCAGCKMSLSLVLK